MTLEPFSPSYAQYLIDWIDSAKLNYLWGGPAFEYPLTREAILTHTAKPEVSAFLLHDQDAPAGYIELVEQSTVCARVSRVFVAEPYRGKGTAQQMMQALFEIAKGRSYLQLDLCVFVSNTKAINCYQTLGFSEVKREQGVREFEGESWELIYMSKPL